MDGYCTKFQMTRWTWLIKRNFLYSRWCSDRVVNDTFNRSPLLLASGKLRLLRYHSLEGLYLKVKVMLHTKSVRSFLCMISSLHGVNLSAVYLDIHKNMSKKDFLLHIIQWHNSGNNSLQLYFPLLLHTTVSSRYKIRKKIR